MMWRDKKVAELMLERTTARYFVKKYWEEAQDIVFYFRFEPNLPKIERKILSSPLLVFIVLIVMDLLETEE